jgi:hypothetical protein
MKADCTAPMAAASRNSLRLLACSPLASARAMKVVMVLSRPKTPILLMMSVVDHATENMPSAAGPSSRAMRKVNMPRKFDANIAIVFKKAPRFSSTAVLSTRAGASTAGGETSSAISALVADSSRSRSGVWAISTLRIMKNSAFPLFAKNTLDVALA